MTTTDINSVRQLYPENLRIFSGSPKNASCRQPTQSFKHSNGHPEQLLSTTDRATPILALKELAIGSSPNISSGDTWNASGTVPEPFPKIHQNWIPKPFRNHSGKLTKILFRKRYGIQMDTPSSVRTATHLLLIPPMQKTYAK